MHEIRDMEKMAKKRKAKADKGKSKLIKRSKKTGRFVKGNHSHG